MITATPPTPSTPLRCYIDTSVWGGMLEPEFEREGQLLYEMVMDGRVYCLYSEVVEKELADGAPPEVRVYFETLPNSRKERVEITSEVRALAEAYISEGIIGASNMNDCLHIAAASVGGADVLASWNFKHIVNVYRVKGYNEINARFGYKSPTIYTPPSVVYNADPNNPWEEVREDDDEYHAVLFFRKVREKLYKEENGIPCDDVKAYLDRVRRRMERESYERASANKEELLTV